MKKSKTSQNYAVCPNCEIRDYRGIKLSTTDELIHLNFYV
jgi:hypothetical protein